MCFIIFGLCSLAKSYTAVTLVIKKPKRRRGRTPRGVAPRSLIHVSVPRAPRCPNRSCGRKSRRHDTPAPGAKLLSPRVCVCVGGLPIAVGSVHVPLLVLSGTAREGARLHGQRTERGLLRETATRFPCWVSASPQGKERPRNRSSPWHPSLSAKARRPLKTRVCRAPRASAHPGAPRASPAPLALLSAFHLAADLAF